MSAVEVAAVDGELEEVLSLVGDELLLVLLKIESTALMSSLSSIWTEPVATAKSARQSRKNEKGESRRILADV